MMIATLVLAAACAAHPVLHLVSHAAPAHVVATAGGYNAKAAVTFSVDTRGIVPGGDRQDHVRGHIQIAQNYARAAHSTIRGFGRTRQDALRNLRAAIDRSTADAQNELAREEALYDRVTDRGLRQDQGPLYGFPGGNNMTVGCE